MEKTYKITFSGMDKNQAEQLGEILEIFQMNWGAGLVLSSYIDESETGFIQPSSPIKNEQEEGINRQWRVELFSDQAPDLKQLNLILEDYNSHSIDLYPAFKLDVIEDMDWLQENRKSFPPIRVGRFLIRQMNDISAKISAQIKLRIGAAMAFGTGNHATTHLCIKQLEKLKNEGLKPESVIDIGCGTAILAMAALNLWKSSIQICDAVDVDQVASIEAKENTVKNNLYNKINVFTGAGFPLYSLKPKQKYDIIIMNILLNPLIQLAPIAKARLNKGGYIIVSGLNKNQKNKAVAAYRSYGLVLCNYKIKNGWCQLTFEALSHSSHRHNFTSSQKSILPWEL